MPMRSPERFDDSSDASPSSAIDLFRALVEAIPQLVWSARPDGGVDYLNPAWYRFSGLSYEESCGTKWIEALHPDDREKTISLWQNSLLSGEPYEVYYRLRNGETGQYRWFIGRANPLHDAEGQIAGWAGTCTDIHSWKLAAEKLVRVNEDLEYFAYAASHDLQEPLRTILLYAQLLQPRLADTADSASMETIVCAGHRMMALLKDLRTFLHSGQEIAPDRPLVPLDLIAQQAVDSLKAARDEADATITIDPLPEARVERSHFGQIVQNLVSNALRYRAGRPAEVRIGFYSGGSEIVFFVEDNGEGIAPEYRTRIFQAFQRLHGPATPGSGLGLTICARIIESYSGRIWVESSATGGSRFLFTLPNAFPLGDKA